MGRNRSHPEVWDCFNEGPYIISCKYCNEVCAANTCKMSYHILLNCDECPLDVKYNLISRSLSDESFDIKRDPEQMVRVSVFICNPTYTYFSNS